MSTDTQYGNRTLIGNMLVGTDTEGEGGDLTIQGTLSAPNFAIQTLTVTTAPTQANDVANKAYVDSLVYTLPAATTSSLGGIKAGTGLSVAVDGTLTASVASSASIGSVSVGTGLYMSGTALNLSVASGASLGGIKVGSGLTIDGTGVLAVGDLSATYATQTNLSGKASKPGVGHNGDLITATDTGDVTASGYQLGYSANNVPYLSNRSLLPVSTIPSMAVSFSNVQNSTINLAEGVCTYKKTITWHTLFNITFTFTPAQNTIYRFELIITSGQTAYIVQLPANITFVGDEPLFNETNHCWRIVFETSDGGSHWLASCNADYEV